MCYNIFVKSLILKAPKCPKCGSCGRIINFTIDNQYCAVEYICMHDGFKVVNYNAEIVEFVV